MRGLVTDILFPNKFSKWRNVEIKNFIQNHDVDILIYKIDKFANIDLGFDWDFINTDGLLDNYNILIFDEKYNYLNKWNKKIDGTKYNVKNSGSFLLTKKNYFDIKEYDFIYHIFLMCYNKFNSSFRYELSKQFIHLYPGGGFFGDTNHIPKEVNVISTHPITTENLIKNNHKNFTEIRMGTLMFSDEKFIRKQINNQRNFTVCFSSMGFGNEKGSDDYKTLSETYKHKFPQDKINFISIGNCTPSQHIKNFKEMDYISLGNFYESDVDVYINLSTNKSFNGWPLGLESVIKGCVLITTDPNNVKKYYQDISGHEFFVIDNYLQAIPIIRKLYQDKNFFINSSIKGQNYFDKYISYSNNQKKIFDFIKTKLKIL